MLRNLFHLWLVCVTGFASPTASIVRLSCDYSGTTTMTVCTFEDACASDPCCPENDVTESIGADCCRTDVFSVASTSPIPVPVAVPPLLPLGIVANESSSLLVAVATPSPLRSSLESRALPLLI